MQDLLIHLMPSFSSLWAPTGEIGDIGAWFWIVMVGIMAISVVAVIRNYTRFIARMKRIRSLIDGADRDNLAQNRISTKEKAIADDPKGTGLLWQEFDESLVYSSDKTKLSNTLDAEHFFNSQTLAQGLTSSRLLAAAPSFLTALGLLGTFVGLMFGLKALQINAGDVETLKDGITVMINGAAVAFMTSVWGVLFSLTLNFFEKMVERSALIKIRRLQHDIDTLYPRLPAEHSLVQIAASADESRLALQELHERIGDRLQEAVSGMSSSMQEAFTRAIETVMEPAIQALVSNTSQQSTQALESLVTQFMEGVKGVGTEQGQLMERAAGEVQQAVAGMTAQMGTLFSQLEEQQLKMKEHTETTSKDYADMLMEQAADEKRRHQQLEESFTSLMAQFGEASGSQLRAMADVSAQHQSELNQTFETALDGLQGLISTHTDGANEREQQIESRFNDQLERLAAEQQQLLAAVSQGVQKTQQQMIELGGQHQQLMSEMKEITKAVQSSSQNMSSAASQLGLLSSNLKMATDVLDKRMETVGLALQGAADQNKQLAGQVGQQAETIQQLQAELLKATEYFGKAALTAEQGFETLERQQQEFLQGVSEEFRQLGQMLTDQVKGIEEQASQWLRSYSSEVRTQVGERMEQWNSNTLQFADEMRRTVNMIGSVVEELEQKAECVS